MPLTNLNGDSGELVEDSITQAIRHAYEEGVEDGSEWANDRIMEPAPQWIDSVARITALQIERQASNHAELSERVRVLEAMLSRVIELEAEAEHLPEPISCDLLTIIDEARALLTDKGGE